MTEKGIKLTLVGECGAPDCRQPLYRELLSPELGAVCVECALCTQAASHELFERSGGRLPPSSGGHCSEDCCR